MNAKIYRNLLESIKHYEYFAQASKDFHAKFGGIECNEIRFIKSQLVFLKGVLSSLNIKYFGSRTSNVKKSYKFLINRRTVN